MNRMKKCITLLLTVIIVFITLMQINSNALADSDDAEFFDYVDFVILIERIISEGNTPEQAIEILIEEAVKSSIKYSGDIAGRLVIDTLKDNFEQNYLLNEVLDRINMKSTITAIDYGITAYGYVGSMIEYYEYICDSDNPYVTSNIQLAALFDTLNLLSTTLKTFLPGIGNLISIPLDLGKNTAVLAQNMLSAFEGRNARLFLEFVGLASNSILVEFARYINVEGILEQLKVQKESLENAKTLNILLGSHIALNEILYPHHTATKETIDSELLELETLIADIENYLSYFYKHAEAAIESDDYKSRMHNKGDFWWYAWKFHSYNENYECVYERKPTIVNLIFNEPEYKTCTELSYDFMLLCMCLEKAVRKLDISYVGNTIFFRHVNDAGNKIVNEAPNIISPLAINLFGDEVETLPINYGIRFDHEGFGNRIATGWVAPNTALLAIDLNRNGMIDNGLELFGNNTRLRIPTAAHGFEALTRWDSNGDGVIDEQDPIFDSLLLWFDLNSNGVSEPNELIPLRDMGIASINLNYVETDRVDTYGNEFRQVSTVTMTNGIEVEIVDIWFITDSNDFELANQVSISERVSALPQIRGFNTVHNLHQAMMLDSSEELIELVEQFTLEKDEAVQRQLARQIMFKWTKTTTVINALAALTGELYTGQTGPDVMALINQTFDDLVNTLYEILMSQSHLSHLYDAVTIVGGTRESPIINLMPVVDLIIEIIINEQADDIALLNKFIRNLEALSLMSSSNISDFLETLINDEAIITTINVSGMIFGTNGNDEITIPNSQGYMVFGFAGNDIIRATGNGNNTIDPGTGNNFILGGTGTDTYIIGRGYGVNHITANSNSDSNTRDKLIFKDSIRPDEIFMFKIGDNLEVFVMSADNISNRTINEIEVLDIVTNKIIFVDFFRENRHRITDISFSDGTNWIVNNALIQSFSIDLDIFTIDDLMNIQTHLPINYLLKSDLDLGGINWQPIGTNINPFLGVFDGNGHTLSNLNINRPNEDRVGMFGVNGGTVRNLVLENATVEGQDNVGILAGLNHNSIFNVSVINTHELIGRNQVGGLVGFNNGGVIQSSSSVGAETLTGAINVGGLIGQNAGIVRLSYSTNDVIATSSIAGGLAGMMISGTLEQSYSTGNVSGNTTSGGFVGYLEGGIIRNCYSTGTVTIGSNNSGFVGYAWNSRIENSYTLTTSPNGLMIGSATVVSSYFDNSISTSTSTHGRTNEALRDQETYVGWNFETIWEKEEDGLPTLRGLPMVHGVSIEIHTLEELLSIKNNLTGNYLLKSDIDLGGIDWQPIGTNINPFLGVFDGNGHTLSNLNINRPNEDRVGMFGVNGGTVKNLVLENATVEGQDNVGILAGLNHNSIFNVSVINTHELIGRYQVGGLVGFNNSGVIQSSSSMGAETLTGAINVGGLVGQNAGIVRLSYSTNDVIATSTTAGGLAGMMISGTLEQSYSTGNVSGNTTSGGFVGYLEGGIIRNCYSTGTVTIGSNNSGFVGYAWNSRIENSYTLTTSPNGLMIGSATVVSSYFDNSISTSISTHGRTSEALRDQETYVGWNFETIWEKEEDGLPTLRGLPMVHGVID